MEMFEKAVRKGLRFESAKGLLTVEDLWNLPLTSERGVSLDGIAKGLYKKIKEAGEIDSFVDDKPSEKGNLDQLAFDIVKYVISEKKAEREAAQASKARKEIKDRVLALIDEKKDDALKGKSLEELQAFAATL